MKNRAIRRHHKFRMRARAEMIYNSVYGIHRTGEKLGDNITICSCYMCGNPRKHFKDKTIAELKFECEEYEDESC